MGGDRGPDHRALVRTAAATVSGMVPPPEAIPDGDWRAELAKRIAAVSGFVKILPPPSSSGPPPRAPRCWPP
ncbi:MAG: hypothetical protein M3460_28570 [Actinomycetota bacterium]|nr:hypothetical protein [Actinomycetota bacterium]